jgi:hypothetical protein
MRRIQGLRNSGIEGFWNSQASFNTSILKSLNSSISQAHYGNIKACCHGSFCAEAQLAYEDRGEGQTVLYWYGFDT